MDAAEQLIAALGSAQMSVGKWASNEPSLLSNLGGIDNDNKGALFQDENIVSTLGLLWQPNVDVFWFQVASLNLNPSGMVTKRRICSDIGSGKVLVQNLWIRGDGCADILPQELQHSWLSFKDSFRFKQIHKTASTRGSYLTHSQQSTVSCQASATLVEE